MIVTIIMPTARTVYLFTIHLLNCASAALLVFIQPTVSKLLMNPQTNQQKIGILWKKQEQKQKLFDFYQQMNMSVHLCLDLSTQGLDSDWAQCY